MRANASFLFQMLGVNLDVRDVAPAWFAVRAMPVGQHLFADLARVVLVDGHNADLVQCVCGLWQKPRATLF